MKSSPPPGIKCTQDFCGNVGATHLKFQEYDLRLRKFDQQLKFANLEDTLEGNLGSNLLKLIMIHVARSVELVYTTTKKSRKSPIFQRYFSKVYPSLIWID